MKFLKIFFIIPFCSFLELVGTLSLYAEEPIRVLFVGNSLTHRIREVDLPNAALGTDRKLDPHFHTKCGSSLSAIVEEPTVTCGTLKEPYTDGSIYDALKGEAWDGIVFQPFSSTAHKELEAIKTMLEIHRCEFPDNLPQIYLYATWPGRPDGSVGGFKAQWDAGGFSPQDTFARNKSSFQWLYFRLIADCPEWSIHYVGVGDILAKVETLAEAGRFPTIGSVSNIFVDEIHLGNIGHWITAQSMVVTILGVDPIDFNDAGEWYNNPDPSYRDRVLDMPTEERALFKDIIRSVLEQGISERGVLLQVESETDQSSFNILTKISYDHNIRLERSSDLLSWENASVIAGENQSILIQEDFDKTQEFFRAVSLEDDELHYYQPNESKIQESRVEFKPADLNHIIIAGQSNAVGFNGSQGAPITINQPFDNLMFSPLLMWEYYANSNVAQSSSDSSALDHRLWIGSGLRGPTSLELLVDVNGIRYFWGPGGKATTAWQYERYREALSIVDFQPLQESMEEDGKHAESFASTVCNSLTKRTGARFFGSVSGIGGASLYCLDARERSSAQGYPYRYTVDLSAFSPKLVGYYGTGAFAQTLAQVERAHQLANQKGMSYKVASIVWVQGEADNNNSNYADEFSRLVNLYNICIKAITGQVEDIFFFTDFITYNQSFAGKVETLVVDEQILLAHQDFSSTKNGGRVYCVGPRYPYNPTLHYAPQSVVAKGEVIAQAIERVLFKRRPWEPLSLKAFAVSGNNVVCEFHVPVPPLQFDVTKSNSVSRPINRSFSLNYGFDVTNSLGESIINEVAIISPSKVRLGCSETPVGGNVSYGNKVLNGGFDLRGNLCDSHTYPSLETDEDGSNYDTRNWCMPFDHEL